jgi:hypothetical protein
MVASSKNFVKNERVQLTHIEYHYTVHLKSGYMVSTSYDLYSPHIKHVINSCQADKKQL